MKISVLDCTLRDGGYINNFRFGVDRIHEVKDKLSKANIEIIECGFLQTEKKDPEYTLYGRVEQIHIPQDETERMYVAMLAYGEIEIDEITPYQNGYISGIRLTFHNDEWKETKEFARNLMRKGYNVFIQPVGTLSYTDEELLYLIKEVNELNPFAFYIVDTLGSMYKNDLLRMFYLVEHNLRKEICLGFHSHNNLQLSFANSITLLELHTDRHIIIDSSAFGMGRGAGNLSTELIAHFINVNIEERYNLIPLLELIDDIILPIYKYLPWGFSEPYYLSAITGVHPNHAAYLIDKQSIGMSKIADMLNKLPQKSKHLFIKKDIDKVYRTEMSHNVEDMVTISELSAKVKDREVLIIAPGGSIKTHEKLIRDYVKKNDIYVISLNFVFEVVTPDLVFISNRKRFQQLQHSNLPTVVTSNISFNGNSGVYVVDYDSLLAKGSDFSGIMVLRFLIRLGLESVALAGYDGFTGGTDHFVELFDSYLSVEAIAALNESMSKQLNEIRNSLKMKFITPSRYDS